MQALHVSDASENWDANRLPDIMLDSPDRVDKIPKQWDVSLEACQGTAEKVPGSRRASRHAPAQASSPATRVSRPERKRKRLVS